MEYSNILIVGDIMKSIKEERSIERIINQISINLKLTKANKLTEKKNEFYSKFLNELPVAVIMTNRKKVLFANQRAVSDIEMDRIENMIGQNVFRMICIKDHDISKQWHNAVINGVNYDLKEVEVELGNKKVKFFDITTITFGYEGEEAIIHVFTDVTDRKLMEDAMIRSEKLAIAAHLAEGIAHEIKNPLTSLKGFFKLIKDKTDKEYFNTIIEDELNRIEQIANELLMLAKPHSDIYKPCSVSNLLDDAISFLEPQATVKGNKIVKVYEDETLMIQCESMKVRQAFINLIKNAIEATTNGCISITSERVDGMAEIKVIDKGIGMPRELLDKAWDPFFTTKEKGTGLGLIISDKIIESHQGTRTIESREGEGTTLTITFPLVK
ncbi:ATP-binding protein [Desertibacillus haloalkaliphilus]|uniref:ATP-binding protein n=1 Tax=Desertibacillus haloalkaliphilus TaxID=1328930 RepID=UPI001C26F089|nr:ATP-binding protein [Desertibacillus haloalkaliphilus]MBU8906288.1 hypothetical protein [Desertibacillus haloalkaliphilus]